jgi:dethiobiotin synthetase
MPRTTVPPTATPGLFVTGTDTDVGKTAVAVSIARQLHGSGRRVGVYKPVASGVIEGAPSDAVALWEAAGRPLDLATVCPQAFRAAIAPTGAAALEGRSIDERGLRLGLDPWRTHGELVIVEGAGGLLSPLGPTTLNADLAAEFAIPLVVVDRARLGAIGRTLATVEAARARGLVVAAVVLSHVGPPGRAADDPVGDTRIAEDAAADLTVRLGDVAVAILGHGAAEVDPRIDWWHVATRARASGGTRVGGSDAGGQGDGAV